MTKKLLFVGLVLLAAVAVMYAADAVTGKWTYEQPAMGRGGAPGGGAPGGGAPGGGAPGGGAPGGGAPGGGAPRIVTLDLKANGAALTGTILQPMGGGRGMGGGGGAAPAAPTPVEIKNGKVDGSKITFEVTREGMNGPTTQKFEGTVTGDSMELKITRDGQNGPTTSTVTAKKG
jgi:hypothetical protein